MVELGEEAFSENEISSLSIPRSLKVFKRKVFFSNNLKTVKFPSTVRRIESSAFRENHIEKVSLPRDVDSNLDVSSWFDEDVIVEID